jgi:signal transduction histidine kinase
LGLRSSVLLPLKIHGDVRGILYIASRQPDYFDAEQKDLLAAIAHQLGASMENRELFDNLKSSRDELEKASKIKDEFLSVMSHELRTPLSVVVGYAGMIKEKLLGEINAQQEEALQKLLTRANDQLNMINAIMQITQLESRALVLERHLLNLTEMLSHMKTDYDLSHTKEHVAFVWDYPAEPVTPVTDGGKLKEILVNLINNAVKFTSQGSVTVSMRLTEDQRKRWVELSVADTGVGIAKEHLSRIFDKFYQIDSSETRLYGGVGLGLYIVKHFAEFLGGKIAVASEVGKGTTFTVTVPYAT